MITASKALAQDVSENTKGGWKKIPYVYNRMLFMIDSDGKDTPADKNRTQVIEIFDTDTDTESHSLLEIWLKRQGL